MTKITSPKISLFTRTALFALSTAFFWVAPLAVQAETTAEHIKSSVENFDCVSPDLYRGAQPSDQELQDLANAGMKTIIDLRLDGSEVFKETETVHHLGLNYVHIPIGFKHRPSTEQIALFMSTVTDPTNQPVFVHCRQGADRTGTCCAVYRRLVQGWSYRQAYREMRLHHFKPFLHGMKQVVRNCGSFQFARHYRSQQQLTAVTTDGIRS